MEAITRNLFTEIPTITTGEEIATPTARNRLSLNMEDITKHLMNWNEETFVDIDQQTKKIRRSTDGHVEPQTASTSELTQRTNNVWCCFSHLSCCIHSRDSGDNSQTNPTLTTYPSTKSLHTDAEPHVINKLGGAKLPAEAFLFDPNDADLMAEMVRALLESFEAKDDANTCLQIYLIIANTYNEVTKLNGGIPRELAFTLYKNPYELAIFIAPPNSESSKLNFNIQNLLQGTVIDWKAKEFQKGELTLKVDKKKITTLSLMLERTFDLTTRR